jgi:HTH-type transcriptional regulator/antitoxin HigA
MVDQLIPARIITPGRILSRELAARSWSPQKLAQIMGCPSQTINDIIDTKQEISPPIAIKLSAALNMSAEFWLNLELNYRDRLSTP